MRANDWASFSIKVPYKSYLIPGSRGAPVESVYPFWNADPLTVLICSCGLSVRLPTSAQVLVRYLVNQEGLNSPWTVFGPVTLVVFPHRWDRAPPLGPDELVLASVVSL